MGKKQARGKTGTAAVYTTRNRALTKLQLKLPEFRRLCILKGVFPREPKKKVHGQRKTYYHAKDIAWLAHEPLLDRFREQRAYEKRISKAHARQNLKLAQQLKERRPGYTLDHLVRQRYPSFVDALRDLDDPLSLLTLFGTLPAEREHKIPTEMVHASRRLALEFQAHVVRSRALRKVFVSVKGIYYQAEVQGQTVTWLAPHALAQVLPADVDYRVMLTFLEFYHTLLSFVNFKLYHDNKVAYPPLPTDWVDPSAVGLGAMLPSDEEEEEAARARTARAATPAAADGANADDADAEESGVFEGLVFYLGRETPKESLMFVIRAKGGRVAWDGEGSPMAESDARITHSVCDRPKLSGDARGDRDYVQPQWVFDCANQDFLIPTEAYGPGKTLPPHLSPFVDDEAEGYVPDYAEQLKSMKEAAEGAAVGGGDAAAAIAAAANVEGGAVETARELALEAEEIEARRAAEVEGRFAAELAAEREGVPYSEAQRRKEDGEDDASEAAEEEAAAAGVDEEDARLKAQEEEEHMAKALLPRKKQKLYDAMQMSLSRKRERVNDLMTRRKSARTAEAQKKTPAKKK